MTLRTFMAHGYASRIHELQGENFFDLLDDISGKNFNEAISTEMLHFLSSNVTTLHHSNTIQEIVTTKKLHRQLLITGYLKKITDNNDRSCMSNTIAKGGIDDSSTRMITIM
ncbi:hypothetical protein LOAG_10152, partial [Loa loa]